MQDIILNQCPLYLVSRVSLTVTSALKKGLKKSGLLQVKPAYLGVLVTLWARDGLKAIELSRKTGLEPSSMTGLLDRMEHCKLVKRTADPSDRRAHRIYLTHQGIKIKELVTKVVNTTIDRLFIEISDNKMQNAKDVLRHVLITSKKEMINDNSSTT